MITVTASIKDFDGDYRSGNWSFNDLQEYDEFLKGKAKDQSQFNIIGIHKEVFTNPEEEAIVKERDRQYKLKHLIK